MRTGRRCGGFGETALPERSVSIPLPIQRLSPLRRLRVRQFLNQVQTGVFTQRPRDPKWRGPPVRFHLALVGTPPRGVRGNALWAAVSGKPPYRGEPSKSTWRSGCAYPGRDASPRRPRNALWAAVSGKPPYRGEPSKSTWRSGRAHPGRDASPRRPQQCSGEKSPARGARGPPGAMRTGRRFRGNRPTGRGEEMRTARERHEHKNDEPRPKGQGS